MAERDGSLAVFGPDPPAIRLLIAAVMCAECGEFSVDPREDVEIPEEIAGRIERYAQYLALFFVVTRRKRTGTTLPGPSRGSDVKGADCENRAPLPEGSAAR